MSRFFSKLTLATFILVVILVSMYSNCGDILLKHPSTSNSQTPTPSPTPIVIPTGNSPGPSPEPECINLERTVSPTDELLHKWSASFDLGQGESKKFCLNTVQTGALVAEILENAPCENLDSDLSLELRDSNGTLGGPIPPKAGIFYQFGHKGWITGSYTLNVKQNKKGCHYSMNIWQAFIEPTTARNCLRGTWPPDELGQFYFKDIDLLPGNSFSYCMRVPEDAVSIQCTARNTCAYPGGLKRVYLRHTDLDTYPQIISYQVSPEPGNIGFSQKMGGCGFIPPGCPQRFPGGVYELRVEGIADNCVYTNFACGMSY